MSKDLRRAVVAVTVCFAMAASAQGTVTIGKDGNVQVTKGNKTVTIDGDKVNVQKGDKKVKVDSSQVEVQADDDDNDDDDDDTSVAAGVSAGTVETDGSKIEINGVNRKDTIRCASTSTVEINGTGHDLALVGECDEVEVNGSGNRVKVEAAKSIEVNGTSNTVTWKRGVGSKKPKVERSGIGNKVSQEK
jgi:hypothetical protein